MTRRMSWIALGCALGLLADAACLRAQAGAVEGTVILDEGPARRTASRYPSGGAAARSMQPVPVVVFLELDPAAAADGGAGVAAVGARATAPAAVDVLQLDTAFSPSALVVRSGTVVRFPNADPFYHNVFSYSSNARFDLGRYPEGESREVRLDRPGVVRVFCEIHEFMRAVIVVTDHPFHAVVSDDGAFRIEGVPPGEHVLVGYHPDVGRREARVTVNPGGSTRVLVEFHD